MSRTFIRCFIAICYTFGCATTAGNAQNTASSEKTQQSHPEIQLPRFYSSPPPNPHARELEEAINKEIEVFMKPARERYKAGDYAGAEKACLQAIAVSERIYQGQDTYGREFLGQIYLKAGQNAKALEYFRQVYSHGPHERLRQNMTLALCRMGNYEQARYFYIDGYMLECSVGGGKIDPSNVPSTDNLTDLEARALLARGFEAYLSSRPEEAIENFQAADKLVPKNPAVQLFWGEALRRLERYDEAIPHYQIAAVRGNGAVMKQAKAGVVSTLKNIEGVRLWKEQQAKKQAATHPTP